MSWGNPGNYNGHPGNPQGPNAWNPGTYPQNQGPKLNHQQQSIWDFMDSLLKSWGIPQLGNDLKKIITEGMTTQNEITLALSQTHAYKVRFAGNELRAKKGLAQLLPAQYIQLENSYRDVLRAYGMPQGFYDQHKDFEQLIGNDISPSELQTRAQIAHDQYMAAPDYVKNLWNQYFGTKGDAIASILDPKRAMSVIQDRANMVAMGGAAHQSGFGNLNAQDARRLVQAGVTTTQGESGFANIADTMNTDQEIAKRFGTHFGKEAEIGSTFGLDPNAVQKRKTLYDEEQGLFAGQSVSNPNAFGVSQSY